jgi:tetratricopeptide (TPR) repeat protein
MRVIGLLFLLAFSIITASAQRDLVDISLVTFHSNTEKVLLTDHVRKGEADDFLLFMASGTVLPEAKVAEARNRFNAFLSSYKNAKFQNKKNDRKTKQIHDDLHQTFLKKYDEGATFEHIFYNGYYNSLSATALFALAFKELGIPFEIKEDPGSVYLVAYPSAESIKVEAASPLGIITLNDAFQQNYVKILRDKKIISAQEAASQSTQSLFDKYYYGNQNLVTVYNLLGLLYLDDAQRSYESKNLEHAYAQAEKAYVLYPGEKTSYILMVTGSAAFGARKQNDSIRALQLAKLSGYTGQGITSDMIQSELAGVIQVLLFEEGKRPEIQSFYEVLDNHITNIQIKNDLAFIYNYETGRYLNSQGKFNDALPFFEKSMKAKPERMESINGLIGTLAGRISDSGDNVESLKLAERYSREYPTLHNSNVFNNMLLSMYLVQVAIEFDTQNPQQGENYRGTFEQLIKKYPDVQPNAQLIGQAYSRAAIYFYRKGQTQKAKSLIETGLNYSPNNYELISRKRMIN